MNKLRKRQFDDEKNVSMGKRGDAGIKTQKKGKQIRNAWMIEDGRSRVITQYGALARLMLIN